MKKTVVYYDLENINHRIGKFNESLESLNFFSIIQNYLIKEQFDVLESNIYANFDIEDFKNINFQTTLQKFGHSTKHSSTDGKNSGDIILAVDLLDDLFSNENIDSFIIFSNDRDFVPLLKKIRKKGKEAIIFGTSMDINDSVLINSTHTFYLEDIFKLDKDRYNMDFEVFIEKIKQDKIDEEELKKVLNLVDIFERSNLQKQNSPIYLTGFSYFISKLTKKTAYENLRLLLIAISLGEIEMYKVKKGDKYYAIRKVKKNK